MPLAGDKRVKQTQFAGLMRKTNPIWAAPAVERSILPLFQHASPMPILQNEPNSPPHPRPGEPMAQNEPNFRRGQPG